MSYQNLRSSSSGTVPTTSQLSEGQLFINLPDRDIYTKEGSSIVPLSGQAQFTTTTSGGLTTVELPNGLKIMSGEVQLTRISEDYLTASVSFPEEYTSRPAVVFTVDSDRTTNQPPTPLDSFSTRVDPSSTGATLVARTLEGTIPENFTMYAYITAIGI